MFIVSIEDKFKVVEVDDGFGRGFYFEDRERDIVLFRGMRGYCFREFEGTRFRYGGLKEIDIFN